MEAQEIFDKTAKHLFDQDVRSATSGGACRYRLHNLKCAVGCHIPDEIYSINMENRGVNSLIAEFNTPAFFYNHVELLRALQRTHDNRGNWHSTGYMQYSLETIAGEFGLNMTNVKDLKFSNR